MELRHLRYFTALAETLNFTRAAARVHVSQSTLSHQIRQLEEQLGLELFSRVGKRVSMTDGGEVFLDFVTRALKEIDQGISALRLDPNELTGSVRVGSTHTFNMEFIPACVAAFLTKYPSVGISVDELSADAIDSGIKKGGIDIGITYRPIGQQNVRFEPLYNEEMVLVVSATHPFAGRKRIRMVELHHQKLVLLSPAFTTRQMLNECFIACGAEPMVVAEMNSIAPMLGLVERTDIGAIVSWNALFAARHLRTIPIENPTPIRTPGMLWKKGVSQSPLVKAFAAIVRSIAIESERTANRSSRRSRNAG